MTHKSHQPNLWPAATAVILITAVMWQLNDRNLLSGLRLTAHNMMLPGRNLLLKIQPPIPDTTRPEGPLQNQLLNNELQRRQLILENARLRQQLRHAQTTQPFTQVLGRDLVDYVAVKARVLSKSGLSNSLRQLIVDAGSEQGLRQSEVVIQTNGILVDKGRDHGLQPGQKVAAGATVIGRLDRVSRWVSDVQPITSVDFSATVQLLHRSGVDTDFGAHGILVGDGHDKCRITGIPYTAVVDVGDEVYSAGLNGIQGPRLFYGTVQKATFQNGGQWEILVSPAGAEVSDEVAVIRQRLDSERVSGHSTTEIRETQS